MDRQRYQYDQTQTFTKQCLEQAREEYIQVQRYLQEHDHQPISKQLTTTNLDRMPTSIHLKESFQDSGKGE